jgi:hypothetical protein
MVQVRTSGIDMLPARSADLPDHPAVRPGRNAIHRVFRPFRMIRRSGRNAIRAFRGAVRCVGRPSMLWSAGGVTCRDVTGARSAPGPR